MGKHYDIFISYRRQDVGEKAEHLKDLLEPYYRKRISFDRENVAGLFDVHLIQRIDNARDFILLLGKQSLIFEDKDFTKEQVALYQYLGTCTQEEFNKKIKDLGSNYPLDFVRVEIVRALNRDRLNILPVVPESSDKFDFANLELPDDIGKIKRYEALFYSESPQALFNNIIPRLLRHLTARSDKSILNLVPMFCAILCTVLLIGGGIWWHKRAENATITQLKSEILFSGSQLNWRKDVSREQIEGVRQILDEMIPLKGGTFMMGADSALLSAQTDLICPDLECPPQKQKVGNFWISKYELSAGLWAKILNEECDPDKALYPKTDISYEDCERFITTLHHMTGLNFAIPTEAEWEYAARGGDEPDLTIFAGNNSADSVAWYATTQPHPCSATHSGKYCNSKDLFDMSGNVCEWCSTDFRPYTDSAYNNSEQRPTPLRQKVVRGGNYLSAPFEVTVFHRDPMGAEEKSANVGLRLIIRP